MQAYALTRLSGTDSVPVAGLYETATSAMLAHNERYFGSDFGTAFPKMEGWEPYDPARHARQGADEPPEGAEVYVFDDEGDLVFVVGLEIQP